MVNTAVILAGGLGTRLKNKTKYKPKGFLEINGVSLIKRSISLLLEQGIEKIFIGTGYLNEVYDEFASHYPQITTIKSDRYTTTSSMYTLFNMRHQVNDDFLLLESDLLYDKNALLHLLNDPIQDIILASGETSSNDEVFIEVDKDNNLVNLSKQATELGSIHAELVGISKISKIRYSWMNEAFEKTHSSNPKADYEHIMVNTTTKKPFYVKKINELVWCEIDNDTHLERAITQILPRLEE